MKLNRSWLPFPWYGYFAWMLAWSLIQFFVLMRLGLEWKIALADASLSGFFLADAGIAADSINRFYFSGKRAIFLLPLLVFALSSLCVIAVVALMNAAFPDEKDYLRLLDLSIPARFAFALPVVSFFVILSINAKKSEAEKEAQKRKSHTEQLLREAELARLRQQLHPHFLFNSLNSISALVGSRPEEARKMLHQLSDFLRGTLRKDDQQLVSLGEELHLLQLYMDIEKVRFSHRLSTPVESSEESLPLLLPPLLLQPVVENAIKFGLYDTTEAVTILIRTWKEMGMLMVEISNPFDPSTAKPRQGAGFGLDSIRKRLFLLYGRNDLLSVEQEGAIYKTFLKIPQPNA